MWPFAKHHNNHHGMSEFQKKLLALEQEQVKLQREDLAVDRAILRQLRPRLSTIKLGFTEKNCMPPAGVVIGPAVIDVDDVIVAVAVGFDQQGNEMPADFVMPELTLENDNPAATTLDDATDQVTGIASGVSNIKGTVQGPNGPLTDTETVTVREVAPPEPVLTTIKVGFKSAAAPAPTT